MFLPTDVQHKLNILRSALESISRELLVFEGGIEEETGEINMLIAYMDATYSAIDFIKSNNVTVSMEEYRKIKSDLKKAREVIDKKSTTLNNLRALLVSKKKEVVAINNTISIIVTDNTRGVVLPFRKKNETR